MALRILTVLLTLLAGLAQAQEKQDPKPGLEDKKSPESQVTAIVRITADPASGLANRAIIEALMTPAVIEETLKTFAKKTDAKNAGPPKPIEEVVDIQLANPVHKEIGTEPAGVCTFIVAVRSHDQYVDAANFAQEWGYQLSRELGSLTDRDIREHRLHDMRRRQAEMAAKVENDYKALIALAKIHGTELTSELVAEREARAKESYQMAHVQLQGLAARQKVLEAQLAETAKASENVPVDDPVYSRLKNIVAIQKQALEVARVLQKNAKVSPAEVLSAEEKVARAEAEVAQYKRDVLDAGSGRRLAELRARLETTLEERAELEARLEALKELVQQVGVSVQVEMKTEMLEAVRQTYRNLSEQVAAEESRLSAYNYPRAVVKILTRGGK